MTNRQTASLAVVVMVGLLLAAGDPQRDAAQLVQRGLEHFRDDQFAEAEAAFARALEIVPENDIVLFDQGCAALSAGKRDEARSLLRSVTLSRQQTLAAKAHYNLGSLETTAARELLGAEPEAAEGDTRTESIALLQAAVQQYRSTLQRQPDHAAARHNLELVRLYIKHLQSQWAERDRQKNRDEKNLLQFLEMIEQRQFQLRTESRPLADAGASAFASQAAYETADALRTLEEEIGPLKDKIASELQGPPSSQPSVQSSSGNVGSEAIDLLLATADRMGEQLLVAADQLESRQATESVAAQTTGLARTNELYTAIAPYTAVLQRAIQTQKELLPPEQAESVKDSSADADPSGNPPSAVSQDDAGAADTGEQKTVEQNARQDPQTAAAESEDRVSAEQIESQQRVALWSTALPYKAEAELPRITAQLEQLPEASEPPASTTPPAPANASGPAGQPDPQQQREQLEGLIESMNLAIELGPQAASEAELALGCLQQQADAEPHQSLTLKILEEIAEPLKDDQSQDNNQQDQNEQNEDQNEQNNDQDDQNKDQQDQNNSDSDQNENKDDDGQKNQQNEQPSENQQQDKNDDAKQDESSREKQDQQARRQRAESILRQAAEREREHREQQKRIRALLQRAIKVDRDW